MKKGFTLLEIVITLGIVAIAIGIFSVYANSSNIYKISRDSQRLSDANNLALAISTYIENATSVDLDGPFLSQKGADENQSSIFISVPSDIETAPSPFIDSQMKSWNIVQSTSVNFISTNGGGWLPINFSEMLKVLISELPVDPVNLFSKNYFYSFVFKKSDNSFEININFESESFSHNGNSDKESRDSGDNDDLYEAGTNLNLIPSGFYQ